MPCFVCFRMEVNMAQDIFAGVLCALVLAVGVWSWWSDSHGTSKKNDKNKEKESN